MQLPILASFLETCYATRNILVLGLQFHMSFEFYKSYLVNLFYSQRVNSMTKRVVSVLLVYCSNHNAKLSINWSGKRWIHKKLPESLKTVYAKYFLQFSLVRFPCFHGSLLISHRDHKRGFVIQDSSASETSLILIKRSVIYSSLSYYSDRIMLEF